MPARKSPRGWGSYLPHPGGFIASIYIKGKRERRVLPTEPLAQAWLKTMRARKTLIEAGALEVPGLAEDVRFRDLEDGFLARAKQGFRRVPTRRALESLRSQVRLLLTEWGPRRVTATTERDVAAYVGQLRRAGLSTSTVRHRLDRLSQLVRYAVEQGYIGRAPCVIRRPGIVLKSRPDAASEASIDALLKLARGNVRAVILLAADAGLRREEIRRFRDGDTYPDHLHVAVRGEGERTKSGHGRDVPLLTGRLRDAIAGIDWHGWPPSDWKLRHELIDLSKLARVRPALRLHTLRHRFVTRLLAEGVPLARVQGWAGHSTPAVTMRYAHLDPLDVPKVARGALDTRRTLRRRGVSRGNVG